MRTTRPAFVAGLAAILLFAAPCGPAAASQTAHAGAIAGFDDDTGEQFAQDQASPPSGQQNEQQNGQQNGRQNGQSNDRPPRQCHHRSVPTS